MTYDDEVYGRESDRGKQRRLQRACDLCRQRKSRCDGSQMLGNRCTTCVDANLDCTYVDPAPKRGRKNHYVDGTANTYVNSLESRLEKSEALNRQLRAELANAYFVTSDKAPGGSPSDTDSTNTGESSRLPERHVATLQNLRTALGTLSAPPLPPHDDDLVHLDIQRQLEKLTIGDPLHRRFIGRSSPAALIDAAVTFRANLKREDREGFNDKSGTASPPVANPDPTLFDEDEPCSSSGDSGTARRPRYWTFKPWKKATTQRREYSFPPTALMVDLIELYFEHVNMYLPLLHRPTFKLSVAMGLHLKDDGFAATLLLVCAVASRWSTDPRVIPPVGTETGGGNQSDMGNLACGWQWFDQVPLVGMLREATLYDLQYYCLAVQFLEGSWAPQACWTFVGVALRLAQDVGVHRRMARVEQPSVERELWKRAFWVLVHMDRTVSSSMGRPCALQYDDFDIDMPIAVDDDYWEHPTHPFQQPPNIPSHITFFNSLLRLSHILAFCLKILYSTSKVRRVLKVDDSWQESAVAELDSALNSWRDQVPEHLRWNPAHADPTFFDQSVALHCGYYQLQILIHRSFIPVGTKSAPTGLPSLAICASAARACANIVDVQRHRKGPIPVIQNLAPVFMAGLVLILNAWSGRRKGLGLESNREIANVHKCMDAMRLCEDRWQSAGREVDILARLASVGPFSHPRHRTTETGVDEYLSQTQEIALAPVSMEQSAFAPTPEDLLAGMHTDPAQASRELNEMMGMIDSDLLSMWTNAPSGFEVDDWGTYFNSFSGMNEEQQQMR
ncbi:fungal-specific transcription factor domain-containing protein [Mycena crocata]|nr:fungal-specific transcription factor domain-containing protein [Mycena crocata]